MAVTPKYPKKLFYKIHEVAEIVGVESYVLRYWETRFPKLKPDRFPNDERRYRQKDIEQLLRIRGLLYDEKYTIAGAVEKIRKDPTGAIAGEFSERVVVDETTPARDQLELFADGQAAEITRVRSLLGAAGKEIEALLADLETEDAGEDRRAAVHA